MILYLTNNVNRLNKYIVHVPDYNITQSGAIITLHTGVLGLRVSGL